MSTSWLVRILTTFGALAAGFFLVAFLSMADVVNGESDARVAGLVLVAMAAGLSRVRGDIVVPLSSLTLGLAGQIFLLIGFFADWVAQPAALGLLLVQGVLFAVDRKPEQRFLSAASSVVLLAFGLGAESSNNAVDAAVLVGVAATAFLVVERRRGALRAEWREPAIYGWLTGVLALLLPSALPHVEWPAPGAIATVGLALMLGAFAVHVLRERGLSVTSEAALVIFGTLALAAATWNAPGIVASLGLLGAGFYLRENRLVILAAFFVAVFLTGFYYRLDLELIAKSGVLAASGAVLLGLRFYLDQRFRLEEAS